MDSLNEHREQLRLHSRSSALDWQLDTDSPQFQHHSATDSLYALFHGAERGRKMEPKFEQPKEIKLLGSEAEAQLESNERERDLFKDERNPLCRSTKTVCFSISDGALESSQTRTTPFEKMLALPQLLLEGMNDRSGLSLHKVFRDDDPPEANDPITQKAIEKVLGEMSESDRSSLEIERKNWREAMQSYDQQVQRALSGTGGLGFPDMPIKPERIRNFEDNVETARMKIIDAVKNM